MTHQPFAQFDDYRSELALYAAVLLAVPVAFGHLQGLQNQLLVGTLVNAVLFVAARRFSAWKILVPLAVVPSIGAWLSGIVFGIDSKFLLYFLPAIWIANLLFMKLVKLTTGKKTWKTLVFPSVAKAVFLFATALFLVSLNAVPSLFLIAMGPLQLATALTGSFAGLLGVAYLYNRGR
ncbi:MAG: hypothetical protein V1717_03660 [Candidatus Micrarchaeota archaeon]